MPDLRDLIAPGRELTGRILLNALELAGKAPIGGRGVIVSARGSSDAVVNRTGNRIIVKRRRVEAILVGSVNQRQDSNGFNVEYKYDWEEAEVASSGLFQIKPGGKSSTDLTPKRFRARNYAEMLNELPPGSGVSYGIPIDSVPPGPAFHIDGVFPIPNGQPVTLIEAEVVDPPTGTFIYFFEATGHLNLICGSRP